MRATAFCPGHITGFFQICEHDDIMQTGSRGAGICIDLGATSEVECSRGDGNVRVLINGKRSKAPVTKQAVARMLGGRELDVHVKTRLDLPISQGLGMSAAGAVSSSLALAELLGLSQEDAFTVAHEAEILHRSGLGDVPALTRGGVTFRRKEGLPPFGRVDRIAHDLELLVCVVGPPIITSSVLSNDDYRSRVNRIGSECVLELEKAPTIASLFMLSREFSVRTGLMTEEVEAALRAIDRFGPASMVMLGNSLFATGELEEQERVLSDFGEVHRVGVDWRGPRIVEGKDKGTHS